MNSINDVIHVEPVQKSAPMKSLKKALSVLDYFSIEQPEWGISDLSRITGLYKSNIHNILSSFESIGYVEKNETTGKYRLGLKFLDKSHVVSSYFTNFDIIHKALLKLSQGIPEIIYFGILHQQSVMYMDAIIPSSTNSLRFVNGLTAPLHCTGLGKALLSTCSETYVKNIMSAPELKRFTNSTIVAYDKMAQELNEIRTRGYAIDNMEHEFGIKCVAVPVIDHKGCLCGAISVTGPSLRFNDEQIIKYATLLQNAVFELKSAL